VAIKKKLKSEETKQNIIQAAKKLFAQKTYHAVTMREIAKEAGCSHTAIYIYFKDKEMLLEQISIPPLENLNRELESISRQATDPLASLEQMCLCYVRFGITHRTLYTTYITTLAQRVDATQPDSEINLLRIKLFNRLTEAIRLALDIPEDGLINITRMFFYQLHGTIMTYSDSPEADESILERVLPITSQFVHSLIRGLKG
jgi:AcrR family transcriptional regulator